MRPSALYSRGVWRIFAMTGLVIVSIVLARAGRSDGLPTPETESRVADIIQTLSTRGHFTTLIRALGVAGLSSTLAASGPFTLFAPDDEAFGRLPRRELDSLFSDTVWLGKVLSRHVVPTDLPARDLAKTDRIRSLHGEDLRVEDDHGLTVNGIIVSEPDIRAGNGVIHVIEAVLPPNREVS